ncbi:hypothetical protein FEF65_02760 [Mariprofundus erugo]|uniref:DUF6602 domain-containing protein n=1 Tax=Mariprofundus erugo TaxID=2528639 RepID=A0A5R9H109_9PROT|nr:DUF6602 domain-containing protein [Mariprofundus erugo]TLS68644.1 hypothetical protein FEF65_02760 [Mariprofundus erugo]
MFTEFDQYSEDLLRAQYDVSEIIEHLLTRGEIREDFLQDIISSRFDPRPKFARGVLTDGIIQSPQQDLLLSRPHAMHYPMGHQIAIHPDNCLCAIEVKSNATGTDIRDCNDKVAQIKTMAATSFPLFGMFCYRTDLQEKTILKRFGFSFDAATSTYVDLHDPDRGEPGLPIIYPELDFFVSIEEDKPLYFRKKDDGRFVRIVEYPVIKNVFRLIQSLVSTSGAPAP